MVLGFAEGLGMLLSSEVTSRYPMKTLIKNASIIIAFCLLPFYFQDLSKVTTSGSISSYIFFVLYVLGKTVMFVNWGFVFMLLF